MLAPKLHVLATRHPWGSHVDLLLCETPSDSDCKRRVVTQLVASTVEDSICIEPTCTITSAAAQELMDQLWQCGLRPSEGTGSAGALAATQRHLDDMRRLVFDLVPKKGAPTMDP